MFLEILTPFYVRHSVTQWQKGYVKRVWGKGHQNQSKFILLTKHEYKYLMRFCKASSSTIANCTVVGAGVGARIAVNKRTFYSEWGNTWEATRCNKCTQSEHASHVLFPFLSLARCPWPAPGWVAHQWRIHAPLSNPIIFRVHFQIIESQHFNQSF